ncbi:MAG: hypothetical protein SPE48_00370 [Treponema porcinum]|uniref:Tetratricopeptide repeat-containing protein n=1 Tax=Treponema porcinum TaxID=261392 RepID=A0A1T4JJ03_TREPO|nr:hypothetical protein [Treponema porcinum]MCI6481792.1 hypothetical protein [Treponema porcinum]MDY4468348.1 hypothetical protein [Treponema porcinum]MDY5120347.1 hypothetical protein [Treponema porcinum]SJZ30152.1 hypothetical protein SAMN02745149_00390 [Treponema porcinum]
MHLTFSKQIAALILCFSAAFSVFAEPVLSDFDIKMMDDISEFRLSLGRSSTCAEAVAKIDEYQAAVNGENVSSRLSDEILLSVNNILVWEKYNYLYEENISHPDLEPLIKSQYEKVKLFFKEHKKEKHSKWLYTTSGDILSCCMQFLPLTTAMHEGLTIKKYYDDGLEQDPDFVFCLINIAQWYFYAPVINGGGHGKAVDTLEHSVNVSKSVPEIFYSKVLLSQALFEDKQYDACAALLSEADALYPGTRCVAFYRRINKIGHSYFDYTLNRKKVDKKLAKEGV